jgi:hypothetical protein
MDDERSAAGDLLVKLRSFVAELTPVERRLFAALIAPGVARAHSDDDVEGFGLTGWSPQQIPDALARAIREADVRVEGL